MRIAQVVTYISDDGAFGGPVAVALAQSTELARRGHSVHLYAAWDGIAEVSAPGVTLHLFRVARPRLGLTAVLSVRLALALRRRLRRFDAVHLHFGRDLGSLLAWFVARRARRLVLQPHGMVMPDRRIRAAVVDCLAVRSALRHADSVLALTDTEVAGLRAVAADSVAVSHIDNGLAVPESIHVERLLPPEVLFLARLHPRKQVLVFAEAARRLLEAGIDARFRVIGPDEGDLGALQAFIVEHALEDHLKYDGTVGPGGGPRELARAAVFVLPSIGEVYPMTVLEALAAGTPVVVSSDCGLSALLEPAEAARVVTPSADRVAGAVASLLADETQRRALARRAHAFARTTFSIEAVADRLEAIYAARQTPGAPRIAITQPYVPEYRGALWTQVISRLAEAGIEARVFWGGAEATIESVAARGDLTTPSWSERVPVWEFRWSRRHPPFSYRRLPRGWRQADVLLTEMQVTNVNAWVAALRNRPFVTMGHGTSGTTTASLLANVVESLQNRLASHVLAYTPAGRDAVIELARLPRQQVSSFDNATDTARLEAAMAAVTPERVAQFKAKHNIGPSTRIAMYLGALESYKRIDLLEGAARLVLTPESDWHLVVAGDGPERSRLEALARETGRVSLLGRVGPEVYAPAASEAAVLLNPGRIGLVAVDALAMGILMLTAEGARHAPEFSYLEPGRDVIEGPATPEGYAAAWQATTTQREPATGNHLSAHRSAELIADVLKSALDREEVQHHRQTQLPISDDRRWRRR